MSRQPDRERIQRIYAEIETHPGERPSFIARLLGFNRSTVTRALPTMEEEGYLLSENDGKLYPFRNKK